MSHPRRVRAFIEFAALAARRAAQLGGDVVFATSTPLTIVLPGVYAARRSCVPMVFEVRDLWPEVPIAVGALRDPVTRWVARRLERFAYANATRIVALAPGMKEAIVSTGYPAARVAVIPNGADLDLFAVGDAPGRALRANQSWLGDSPLVLFTGTLGRVNGVDYVVHLAREVARRRLDVKFAILGDGVDERRVRALAAESGVLGRTVFLLGRRPKREMPAWLSASDIVLALFTGPRVVWKDAVQNKFFDALAAGRPVANNFDGWQSRVAVEAGAGLILHPSDHAAAACALLEALESAAWIAGARAAATRLARDLFSRDVLAGDLECVLTDAVADGRFRTLAFDTKRVGWGPTEMDDRHPAPH